MTRKLLLASAIALSFGTSVFGQITFSYTGAMQTYTVPAGVNWIQVECWGAQGPDNGSSTGGLGGYVSGELTVTPGEDLYIYVGGMDGFNGGGAGGTGGGGGMDGMNGGGGSDIRRIGTTLTDRILVAGGGGGAGRFSCANQDGGYGGFPGGGGGIGSGVYLANDGTSMGGGSTVDGGGAGDCTWSPSGGGGGGGDGGGGGGSYGSPVSNGGTLGACGDNGFDGIGGAGSAGGGGCFGVGGGGGNYSNGGGAGGGGGWYGGGAGGGNWAAGGGGGSSYFGPDFGSTSFTNGTNAGDGQIVITELCTGLTTSVSDDEVCEGETVTLSASSILGGTVTWDGGVTDGIAFLPPVGTTIYTAISTDPSDCSFSVAIVVNPLPTVDGGADLDLCDGETATLTGSGTADLYSWSGGVTTGLPFTPPTGTTTYTVTGDDLATGCFDTDDVDVTYTVVDESISLAAGTFTCAQTGATYQWIDCSDSSDIAGETAQTYTPTQDGDYAVIVTIGICTDTSACTNIAGAGIRADENSALMLYPNPANNEVTISLLGAFLYELRAMTGALITQGTGSDKQIIPLDNVASGSYIVRVVQNDQVKNLPLVVR